MSSRVYLVVEGVHDVAFIGKLLETSLQFKRVNRQEELEKGWTRILPTKWPHDGLLRPSVPAPSFYQNNHHGVSLAIANAEGISNMTARLKAHLAALDIDGIIPDAVGAVLDADRRELPSQRFEEMAAAFKGVGLPTPEALETIAS